MATNPQYYRKLNSEMARRLRRIKAIYERTSDNLSRDIWNYRRNRIDTYRGTYYFQRNRLLYNQVNEILRGMTNEIIEEIEEGVRTGWKLTDEKNNLLAAQYAGLIDVPVKAFLNTDALKGFLDRRYGASPISSNVWDYARVGRDYIDNYLGAGIIEGRGAARVAGDIKNALMEPNKLFRRVRDARGNLVLSSAAKKYHPGSGVYRSSYKNALRYTQNEINIAHHYADYERRINAPYVTGIQVKLSASHPEPDMCDSLIGRYPKEFIFTPWHTKCICYTTAILMSREELKAYLRHGVIPMNKMVTKLPQNHIDWVAKNKDTLVKYQAKTAWLKDNYNRGVKNYRFSKQPEKPKINYIDFGTKELESMKYGEKLFNKKWNDLTAPQVRALEAYKSESGVCRSINTSLRKGVKIKDLDPKLKRTVNALDKALAKSTLDDPITVYRGVSKDFADTLKSGLSFKDNGFVSTTGAISKNTIQLFGDNIIRLKVPQGYQAGYVEEILSLGENEFILPRGTEMRILNKAKESYFGKQMNVINAEVVF